MKLRHKVLGSAVFAGALIVGGVLFANSNGIANKLKAATNPASEYVLELNKNNKFTEQEAGTWDTTVPANSVITRKTTSGNDVNFLVSGGRSLTATDNNLFIARDKNGWVCNQTPLSGLYKVDISCSAGQSFRFDFGSVQPLNGYSSTEQPDYVKYQTSELTGQSSYTIDLTELSDNYFSYFRFQQISSGNNWVGSIKLYYTCLSEHIHEWEHFDRVIANRGSEGMEEHYYCSSCGAYQDAEHNPSTYEDLKLTSTLYSFNSGSSEQTIPLVEDLTLSSKITLDVFVDGEGSPDAVYFGFLDAGDPWKRTNNIKVYRNGSWEFTDLVGDKLKQGVTCLGFTVDGYVRFEIDLSLIDKDADFASVDRLMIYRWNHASGYIEINTEGISLARGHQYPGGVDYTFSFNPKLSRDFGIVDVDIYFTSEGKLSTMVGNWNHYNGYYDISPTLQTGNINGITVTKLEDGYIRFEFTLSELTKFETGGSAANLPIYDFIYFRGVWCTASAYIDISYHENHTHSYNKIEFVDAFREDTGVKAHYECDCGKFFDLNYNEILAEDTIEPSRLISFDNTSMPKTSGTPITYNIPERLQLEKGDTFVLDVKIAPAASCEFGFEIGDSINGGNYSKFWMESINNSDAKLQGSYGSGFSSKKLIDGFTRVYIELDDSKINRKNNPEYIQKINYIKFYPGSDYVTADAQVEVLPSKGNLARGQKFVTATDLTVNFEHALSNSSIINVDIAFASADTTKVSISIGDWSNYYGYFSLYEDPSKTNNYAGLTITPLDDEYVRFTFDLAQVTWKNHGGAVAAEPIVNHVFIRGNWSDAEGFIDVSYTDPLDSPVVEDIY